MFTDADYAEVLRHFPRVSCAFAYGSGVIEQGGYNYEETPSSSSSSKMPMLDLIFVVEDAAMWHAQNMKLNPEHYTSLLTLSPRQTAHVQNAYGARVWFNAILPMNIRRFPDRPMKYGVVQRSHLLHDLLNWETLYVAGRLHKPVRYLTPSLEQTDPELYQAVRANLKSALTASLLLMPKVFSEVELYMGIASLSYIGDPRMILGENPKKIVNLVSPIVPSYRALYERDLVDLQVSSNLRSISTSGSSSSSSGNSVLFSQDTSPFVRWNLCLTLPARLRKALFIRGRATYLKELPPKRAAIRTALASVVARAASMQSVKGIFTVGLVKSALYIAEKLKKQFFAKSAVSSSLGQSSKRSFHTLVKTTT